MTLRLAVLLTFVSACNAAPPTGSGDASTHSPDGAIASSPDGATPLSLPFLPGVNLSGGEFGNVIPGTMDKDFTIPKDSEVDYFVGKGMKVVRIPIRWGRLQHELGGELDAPTMARLQALVSHTTGLGAYALLDPHDYARWQGLVIGSGDAGAPTTAQFADLWSKLATVFAGDDHVIFGLMNEPHGLDTNLWLTDANAAIAAIREAGATNTIFVPGNDWTGAHSWVSGGSGDVMINVVDPLDNYVYEVHQYLDDDNSGTHPDCTNATAGADRLAAFTTWAEEHHRRAFIGEFGSGDNATCNTALEGMLAHVDAHRDVYVGWTWWSAGPWWGEYMYTLEPKNGADRPQMAILDKHF